MPNLPAPWPFTFPDGGASLTPWQQHFETLAQSIADALVAKGLPSFGLAANRPAAGIEGRQYYATDTNILWFDDGSNWKNRTPGILAQLTSSTALINGTSGAFTWTNAVTALFMDTGGFFNAGNPTRITAPYDGVYEVDFAIKSNGIAGITSVLAVNGVAASSYFNGSGGPGVAGTAVTVARSFLIDLTAGDYLTLAATSTAPALGSHSLGIKYRGDLI